MNTPKNKLHPALAHVRKGDKIIFTRRVSNVKVGTVTAIYQGGKKGPCLRVVFKHNYIFGRNIREHTETAFMLAAELYEDSNIVVPRKVPKAIKDFIKAQPPHIAAQITPALKFRNSDYFVYTIAERKTGSRIYCVTAETSHASISFSQEHWAEGKPGIESATRHYVVGAIELTTPPKFNPDTYL